MDEFGRLCIGCEGIVIGETIDMYWFVVKFIKKHCPGLPFESVRIVSADHCLDQEIIEAFGFNNALFVIDC